MTGLPELRSPYLPQDIIFRRLLASTESLMASSTQQDTTTTGNPTSDLQKTKLKHFIETLKEQLEDLERNHAIELGFQTLEAYRAHVDSLSSSLPKTTLPLYCQKPRPALPPTVGSLTAASAKSPTMFMPGASSSGQGQGSTEGGSGALSMDAKKKLAHQEAVQEALTDELVLMASALKKSTLDVQDAVNVRGKLVDSTNDHLEKSVMNAKEVSSKSKEQYKSGGSTLCLSMVILLVVGLVFTGMLVYIKFTHLMGYRQQTPNLNRGSSTMEPPRLNIEL